MINTLLVPPGKLGTPPMSENPWQLLPTASNHAAALDNLYLFITALCAISMVIVIGAQVYFMVKYKERTKGQKTSPLTHDTKLEFIWSAIPAVLLVVIFVWGERDFMLLSSPPRDAMEVRITGAKWFWTIEYPNFPGGPSMTCPGFKAGSLKELASNKEDCPPEEKTPTLFVPLNKPVRLTISSSDVIHSVYIPAFRVKKDAVPGRYTTLWFTAILTGEYPLFCTEYCGDQHSSMLGKVIVVDPEIFDKVVRKVTELKQNDGETKADYGKRVYGAMGCPACHSLDGSKMTGPSFKGLYGRQEALSDGTTVTAEDNYIRQSVLDPNSQIVAGYSPQMPSFQGRLKDDQIDALIDFIKTVK